MSVRTSVIQFLQSAVSAASSGNPLNGVQVNDTPARMFQANRAITVMYSRFLLAPNGNNELKEYDGQVEIVCSARVSGSAKTARFAADDQAFALAMGVARLFLTDPTINGSVCDARCVEGEGGWDGEDGQPYQLVGLLLRYNQIGPVVINS